MLLLLNDLYLQEAMEKDEQIEKLKKELEKVPFVVMSPYEKL